MCSLLESFNLYNCKRGQNIANSDLKVDLNGKIKLTHY